MLLLLLWNRTWSSQ